MADSDQIQAVQQGDPGAPTRHPVAWQDAAFYDEKALDEELRRVFDICHGCRRCFNLCESFPRLFDLVDDSESGELDTVASESFQSVVDACTLCDMCFLTKCPYVPPHEFNLDFPHLMLRYRAVEYHKGQTSIIARELTKTDRNGTIGCGCAGVVNWGAKAGNQLTRPLLEKLAGIDRAAYLPPYASKQLKAAQPQYQVNDQVTQRRAVVYATCFANYNNTAIGEASLEVLARNGVTTELIYPQCCGMPQLEHGNLADVVKRAEQIATLMCEWLDKGYDIVGLTPSCSLMIKYEWPLLVPKESPAYTKVCALARVMRDITEYLVIIGKDSGLAAGMQPLEGGVTAHIACHERAQNMGQKTAELLRMLPDTKVEIIERCSGHGGSWGVMKENFSVALKVGRPAARTAAKQANSHLVSSCPLAREHLVQGVETFNHHPSSDFQHPVELIAHAYRMGEAAARSAD